MRLSKKIIDHMAKTVADCLLDKALVTTEDGAETLAREITRSIVADLAVEDRLNEEVKEILRVHSNEIDRSNVDYAQMFTMVKRKLVRERGLIL